MSMDRIQVIERSLACYTCGWLSFIPLVGIPLAARAMTLYHQVRVEAGQSWNPASRYLACGFLLAWVGGFFSVISLGLVFVFVLKVFGDA